jgi:hypothetical protein
VKEYQPPLRRVAFQLYQKVNIANPVRTKISPHAQKVAQRRQPDGKDWKFMKEREMKRQ